MQIFQFLCYLADHGVIDSRPDQRELRDTLAGLGLYPETDLHDIGRIDDPRDIEED